MKLERQSAVDNLDEILKETDIVMVARGDLGVECPLPAASPAETYHQGLQRGIQAPLLWPLRCCFPWSTIQPQQGRKPRTANAVLDGADCVMMSEETAMGNFPVETVQYMSKITTEAEKPS